MDAATVDLLNAYNRRFYERHAASFDDKRRSPWPGWERVTALLARTRRPSILDAGCGNARFGLYADERRGGPIDYVGVDVSTDLLRFAAARCPPHWRFVAADLVAGGLPIAAGKSFDLVSCFGVLHHVPGEATRRVLLESLAGRVGKGGHLAVSFWRFGTRERFRRRALERHEARAWGVESLEPTDLEENDFLLPWGNAADGDRPARYCHFVDRPEAERLVSGLGLIQIDEFAADGHEGDLNHYCFLRRDS